MDRKGENTGIWEEHQVLDVGATRCNLGSKSGKTAETRRGEEATGFEGGDFGARKADEKTLGGVERFSVFPS